MREPSVQSDDSDVLFEVLDVLGAVELVRASATLDGSIPLRAAQACSPLLDGNRFGFQITLRERLRLGRGLGGIRTPSFSDRIARAHAGNFPRLRAEGFFDPSSDWIRRFSRAPLVGESRKVGLHRASLFTGLFVRPRAGTWLRIGDAGNRRNQSFTVDERWIADEGRFVPLVLGLTFAREADFPLDLLGELATLAPFCPDVVHERKPLAEAPGLGLTLASFYDSSYFDDKKRGPTQKYKKLFAREGAERQAADTGKLTVVDAGESSLMLSTQKKFITPGGLEIRESDRAPTWTFANTVPLRARFDGQNTFVDPEPGALAGHARSVEQHWAHAFDTEFVAAHRGAIWYFSKYVTPHQPGEPYFFLKPPALFQTGPGWSLLIEGVPGSEYDVLRGVVASDVFHAAPAVFRLNHPGRTVSIAAGVELARLIPFPRAFSASRFESVEWAYR